MKSKTTKRQYVDYFEVLKSSLKLYASYFGLFIGLSLIGNSAGIISSFINEDMTVQYPLLGIPLAVLFLASLFLKTWVSAAIILAAGKKAENKKINAGDCLALAMERILHYIGYGIILFFIIAIGFLFFVIPGIYLSIIFAFTLVIVMLDPAAANPLAESKKLVAGSFWGILFFFLFVGLALFFVLLPAMMAAEFTGAFFPYLKALPGRLVIVLEEPLMFIITVLLYLRLKKIKKTAGPGPGAGDMAGKIAISCCSGCLLFIIIAVIGAGVIIGAGTKVFKTEAGRAGLIRMVSPVIKNASARVVFPGGVRMELPENTFARRDPVNTESYDVVMFTPSEMMLFEVERAGTDGADKTGRDIPVDSDVLAGAVAGEKKMKKSGKAEEKTGGIDYNKFKFRDSETGVINGKKWRKYTLSQERELEDKNEIRYWDIYFTVHDGKVYTIDYNYPVMDTDESGSVITAYREKVRLYTETGAEMVKNFVFDE